MTILTYLLFFTLGMAGILVFLGAEVGCGSWLRKSPLITPISQGREIAGYCRDLPFGMIWRLCNLWASGEMAFKKTRQTGENPRALGTNPRATESSERQTVRNKWALRNWKRKQRGERSA